MMKAVFTQYKEKWMARFRNSDVENYIGTWAESKNRITCKVVNYEENKEELQKMMHKKFLDFALVPRLMLEEDEMGITTMAIVPEFLKYWGIDKMNGEFWLTVYSHLFHQSTVLTPISEVLDIDDLETEVPLYVLTNERYLNGATQLFNVKVLEKFWEENGNFYILPSSIHEIILVPEKECIAQQVLKDMVRTVNRTIVPKEEQLSDNVYYFDGVKRKITIVE